jgi:hypothetical protein
MGPAEYYQFRLEQTLQHTQVTTKLLYLIDGALLAMLYFAVEKLQSWTIQDKIEVGILVLLSGINIAHSWFIVRQARWYHLLETQLAEAVGRRRITMRGLSSQLLFGIVHWAIAAVAMICAVLLASHGPLKPVEACIY